MSCHTSHIWMCAYPFVELSIHQDRRASIPLYSLINLGKLLKDLINFALKLKLINFNFNFVKGDGFAIDFTEIQL